MWRTGSGACRTITALYNIRCSNSFCAVRSIERWKQIKNDEANNLHRSRTPPFEIIIQIANSFWHFYVISPLFSHGLWVLSYPFLSLDCSFTFNLSAAYLPHCFLARVQRMTFDTEKVSAWNSCVHSVVVRQSKQLVYLPFSQLNNSMKNDLSHLVWFSFLLCCLMVIRPVQTNPWLFSVNLVDLTG